YRIGYFIDAFSAANRESTSPENAMVGSMSDRSEDGSRRWHFHLAVSERLGGIIVAGALATAGALFAWQSSLLDLGNLELPGPGFFPLFLGAVLVAFAA